MAIPPPPFISDSTAFGTSPTVYQWVKITKSYSDFATAGLTNDIEIYSLPAGAMIHGIVIKHTTLFSGGLISAYTLSVGITGNLTKYATPFDVFQAVSNTAFQASNNFALEDWGSATSIRGSAISVGAFLDAATQGDVSFHICISQPKQ